MFKLTIVEIYNIYEHDKYIWEFESEKFFNFSI